MSAPARPEDVPGLQEAPRAHSMPPELERFVREHGGPVYPAQLAGDAVFMGLTVRSWLAGLAMPEVSRRYAHLGPAAMAATAYEWADAMLTASRGKP